MRRSVLALLLVLCPSWAGAEQGAWTLYTASDGLDRNLVFDVAQDRDGYIWATSRVLNRFDGQRFQHFPLGGTLYVDRMQRLWIGPLDKNMVRRFDGREFEEITPRDGLPDSHVQVIFQDSRGDFWFGTSMPDGGGLGVARYTPESGQFRLYSTADGLGGNDIYAIEEDSNGNMWFALSAYRPGAGKGVSRFDGKGFKNFTTADGLTDNETRVVLEDRKKNLWVGSRKGLCRFTGERFEVFTTPDGIGPQLYVQELFEDSKGDLWIATGAKQQQGGEIYRTQGLLRFDGERVTAFTGGSLSKFGVTAMTEDRDGNLWMTMNGAGLLRYDPSFHRMTDEEPLKASGVLEVVVDREDRAFIATRDGRLFQFEGRTLKSVALPNTTDAVLAVTGLYLDSDRQAWVVCGSKLLRADGASFRQVLEESEPIIGFWSGPTGSFCILSSNQVACHGADGSVRRLTRGVELPSSDIHSVHQDSSGTIWVSSRAGLVRASETGVRTFTTADGLRNNRVAYLRTGPDGHLWFTGDYAGLYKMQGDRVVDLSTPFGLEKAQVGALLVTPGGDTWINVWGRGLFRYDGRAIQALVTDPGVFVADIVSLVLAPDGQLWMGTLGGGVTRYDGRAFQTLSTRDGLASDNIRTIAFQKNGTAWLRSDDGSLTRYTPRKAAPTVTVTQAVADSTVSNPLSLELTSSQLKELRFSFQGLSFNVRPEATRYTWRLEGVDRQWQPATTQPFAVYSDLKPGRYTFSVQAIDRDLNYSRAMAVVPVTIHVPWYRNPLYSVSVGLVAASILGGLLWSLQQAIIQRRDARRLRRQLREQEKREKEALAKKNAELQHSYGRLEEAHGKLAETHTELERKSNEVVRSYAELQKALEELKQTQSQLVHSEKMAALGTMVAGVAHEINNPVNFIHANLPTLQEYVDGFRSLVEAYEEGKDKESIEDIKEEIDYEFLLEDLDELIRGCKTGTDRIQQIVLDLRNFSRKDEAEHKPVDLHEGIDSSLTILGNMLKGRITVHKDYGDLPKVPCSAGQINQVVLNLVKNAADAIPGSSGDIWIRTRRDGDNVEISVRDSGTGIPPEVLSKIFDPFFTTKPVGKGTGLGLSVSMQLIEKHGGRLWAESPPGQGATFFIRLPL